MDMLASLNTPDGVWLLCERLRAERLLVGCEIDSLRGLHSDLSDKLTKFGLLSWNNRQHQIALQRLVSSHPLVHPENTTSICVQLDSAHVVPAYTRLGHHHSAVGRILSLLLQSPSSVSEILNSADSVQAISSEDAVQSVFSLLCGNGIFPSDERALLEILLNLIHVQLVVHPDPRLVIRKANASFPRLYKVFSENLFTAKIFLTAALHDSVMLVLCQDEVFLDIDPAKSPLRFPTAERARRFGDDPTNPAYHKRVANHRKIIVEKLILLAHHFIKGICDALSCFPPSLIWLVQQLHSSLVDVKGLSSAESTLICTDLIVTNLLCPAITNPENVGVISDTPISHIARFNLMQLGQIIQTLSLSRHETPPPHFQLFTNQFKDSPICNLVSSIVSRPLVTLDSLFIGVLCESNKTREMYRRTHFIGSLADVNTMVSILHSNVMDGLSDVQLKTDLTNLSRRLPSSFSTIVESPSRQNDSITPVNQVPRQSRLKNFADKVTGNSPSGPSPSSPSRNANTPPQISNQGHQNLAPEYFDVISFDMEESGCPLGLEAEDQFMESMKGKETPKKNINDGAEKRARFVDTGSTVGSAISDRTTDNASDLEEEASEQQEVGSVSSSLEAPQEDRMLLLEDDGASTLPDNVSDVGGMSGRGSPSLSGRDTPLSQAPSQSNREGEAADNEADVAGLGAASTTAGAAVDVAQRNLPTGVPVAVRKSNAEGLEEKFGKFTVPTSDQNRSYRDDQRSLLSDSWSTNVVASDDEGPTPPGPHLGLPGEGEGNGPLRPSRHINRTGSVGGANAAGEDKSDTWSLDAIASDSEADGGRERERQVQDVQYDIGQREEEESNSLPVRSTDRLPLIDISPSVDGIDRERMRRQSSGSSYSRSEAESDIGINRDLSDDSRSRPQPPLIPTKPPVIKRHSLHDQAGPSGLLSNGESSRPSTSSSVPQSSSIAQPAATPGTKKKMNIFEGLKQKVEEKVKRGMNIPHSATISDLLGEWNNGSARVSLDREISRRMTASQSENRIADLNQKSADDILAKYQRPADPLIDLTPPTEMAPPPPTLSIVREQQPYYSAENLTQCRAFLDAKRKLRIVLSSVGSIPTIPSTSPDRMDKPDNEREQLILLLKSLLAEAINGREKVLGAHIREVIRCLQVFDNKGIRKLLRTLREEHRRRTSYVLYLQQSRLTLLRLISYIDKLSARVKRDKTLVEECIVEVLVRFYLENGDQTMKRFLSEFAVLNAQDEKTESLNRTLTRMYSRLSLTPMWKDASDDMISYAKRAIERVIMGQIHAFAFYPNHEADRHRDEVLFKSLAALSRSITPDHPMLRIPVALHGESPWPSAQAEISIINAYKSARDKLACIVRCCETISNLVSMAPGGSPAAADDITPVLVYVLILANPPALLSNVQYMESFGGSLLDGAEGYWWTQFTAAIEFIKTLL